MNDVVKFGHGSDPAHPEAGENQSASIDGRHPQQKRGTLDEEIADQRQHDDGKTDGNESTAEPKPGDAVEQHEIDRPERAELAWPEMAQHHAAQDAETIEQQEHGEQSKIESLHAGLSRAHG